MKNQESCRSRTSKPKDTLKSGSKLPSISSSSKEKGVKKVARSSVDRTPSVKRVLSRLAATRKKPLPLCPSYIKVYTLMGERKAQRKPSFGICLMGGGPKNREALRWFAEKTGGGDLVILSAEDYSDELSNPESLTNVFWSLGCLSSVTCVVVDSREKANDPWVEALLRNADGVFLPGGNQTTFYDLWNFTQAELAINERVSARSMPIGGNSAGMHSMGRLMHTPYGGNSVISRDALRNPYLAPDQEPDSAGITFKDDFFNIPFMENVLTDTHWSQRDRLGRSVVFLARVIQDGMRTLEEARLVACDEGTAVCVEEDGWARVFGSESNSSKSAFFFKPHRHPDVCRYEEPLSWRAPEGVITVNKVEGTSDGSNCFDLLAWEGRGVETYRLNVEHGRIEQLEL